MSQNSVDCPSVAVVLNRDLLFGSRIRGALASLELEATFVGTTEQFVATLIERKSSIAIGIIDMNGIVSWDVVEQTLQGRDDLPPTLAFGPHTDVENRRAAKAAGVTRIVSNGQFHNDMTALVDRYRRR
jgi:hypothetical protein